MRGKPRADGVVVGSVGLGESRIRLRRLVPGTGVYRPDNVLRGGQRGVSENRQLLRPYAAVELPNRGAAGCDFVRRAARKRGASFKKLLRPDVPRVVEGKARIGRSNQLDARRNININKHTVLLQI